MSFKNSIKILISRFNLVWLMLLYLIVFGIIIASLSLSFVVPIVKTLGDFGIFEQLKETIKLFMSQGSWSALFDGLKAILDNIMDIYSNDSTIVINSALLIAVVLTFGARYLLGFYELPLIEAIEGRMSANAKISFSYCMVSQFKNSLMFIFAKIIYTIIFDFVSFMIIAMVYWLLKSLKLIILIPFAIMFLIVLLNALRYSLKVYCAPAMVMEEGKTFKVFLKAFSESLSDFSRVFSNYLIAWLLAITLNGLVFLLTFGVGILVTVPLTVVFFSVLDMTLYYKKRGSRYYIDETNVTSIPQNNIQ